MKLFEPKWLQHVRDIEKHLEKNEKWLQFPEKKFHKFSNEAEDWETQFLKNIGGVESFVKELEKKMDTWE